MRCLALAQWAVELKAKVAVALPISPGAESLAWPCPVSIGNAKIRGHVSIVDGYPVPPAEDLWAIVDAMPTNPTAAGFIYPHFGAVPIPGFPTFVGPQWMPLRRAFGYGHPFMGCERKGRVSYRAPKDLRDYEPLMGSAQDVCRALSAAEAAWVPASTVAYEALAVGCPVVLNDAGSIPAIGDAMVEAGVATRWDGGEKPPVLKGFDFPVIDGLGAKRLLEALL